MPIPNDIFNKIGAAQPNYLSVMDISQGYLNIEIEEADKAKTAFTTTSGRYQFLRMISGLSGAPFTFVKLMQRVLEPLSTNILSFVDDCILFDKDFEDHLRNLDFFFKRINECGLSVKLQKGQFGYKKLPFLGHIIGKDGLEMESSKLEQAIDFPLPKTPKEVQRFLGFINYYGDFIPNLARLRAPFDSAIAQRRVIWTDELQENFDKIKSCFRKDQILAHFDPNKPAFLIMDACDTQVAGVLSQPHFINEGWKMRPVRFISKKLTPAQLKWGTFDKELYAIVVGVKKNYRYLYGKSFTVLTDHRPLQHFDSLKLKTYDQVKVRHALFLSEFDFKIYHISGKDNVVADYMTRAELEDTVSDKEAEINLKQEVDATPLQTSCSAKITSIASHKDVGAELPEIEESLMNNEQNNTTALEFWKKHQAKDPYINSLKNYLKDFTLPSNEELATQILKDAPLHRTINDVVYCCTKEKTENPRKQILVPTHLQQAIVTLHHNTLTSAHPGINYTTERINRNFTWKGRAKTIAEHIAGCKLCQQRKAARLKFSKMYQLFEKPTRFFQQLAIDTVGPIKKNSNGDSLNYVITIVDLYSNYLFASAVTAPTAEEAAAALISVVLTHGAFESLLSDNGSEFANKTVRSLLKTLNAKQKFAIPYRPQTNGTLEKSHQALLDKMTILFKSCPKDANLADYLPFAVYAMNTQQKIGLPSPYFTAFGREPSDINLTNFIPECFGPKSPVDDKPTFSYTETVMKNLEYAKKIVLLQNEKTLEKRKELVRSFKDLPVYSEKERVLIRIPTAIAKRR